MTHTLFYPDLKIVALDHIKLQEYVNKERMTNLSEIIKKEGVLRNPPIVTSFYNGDYMHLDGANRITAVSILKYPACLVQVVDYADPTHVRLTSWSHLVTQDKGEFLAKVRVMPGVRVTEKKTFAQRMLMEPYVLCVVAFHDGTVYEVTHKTEFTQFVSEIGNIVDIYSDTDVERVYSESPWTDQSIRIRFDRFPEHNMFVAFPTFSPQQVISLVDRGVLMPAGLTRHVVYRRKLNINLPLDYLAITPIEKANEKLQQFLQHRHVRLYEEPVIYFE